MFSKTDKKELTFHIEGTPSDGGDVRLGVFASKLDDFRLLFDEAQAAIDRYSKDDLLVTKDALDTLLMPGFSSIGSVKGVVEGYNSHPEEKYFYLYPLIGGRVKCLFDEERRQSAAQAVDKNVLVHGKLKYRGGQFFPYEVEVSSIEILSPDNDLPHLKDVVLNRSQIDSDSTQKIKRLRDEW